MLPHKLDNFQVTSETFTASQSDTGITVSMESESPPNSTRRKRSAEPPPLMPDKYESLACLQNETI